MKKKKQMKLELRKLRRISHNNKMMSKMVMKLISIKLNLKRKEKNVRERF